MVLQVCGNFQSVRQLSEWLKSWHDKGQKSGKKCSSREHYTVEDDEIFSETEFDMDDREDDFKLSNVLLITGPVGVRIDLQIISICFFVSLFLIDLIMVVFLELSVN